jgi:hypothetical protein
MSHSNDLKRAEYLGRLLCITRTLDYDLELLTKEQMIFRLMDGAKTGREIWDDLIKIERTVQEVTK